jgi:hypothetical protein
MVDPDGSLGRPGATIANGRAMPQRGYSWLQVKCHRCETEASIPLEHVRRSRDTPIWKLEAALKCRSCRTPRYSPRVHMIKLSHSARWHLTSECILMMMRGGSVGHALGRYLAAVKHRMAARSDVNGAPYRSCREQSGSIFLIGIFLDTSGDCTGG